MREKRGLARLNERRAKQNKACSDAQKQKTGLIAPFFLPM